MTIVVIVFYVALAIYLLTLAGIRIYKAKKEKEKVLKECREFDKNKDKDNTYAWQENEKDKSTKDD